MYDEAIHYVTVISTEELLTVSDSTLSFHSLSYSLSSILLLSVQAFLSTPPHHKDIHCPLWTISECSVVFSGDAVEQAPNLHGSRSFAAPRNRFIGVKLKCNNSSYPRHIRCSTRAIADEVADSIRERVMAKRFRPSSHFSSQMSSCSST